MSRSAELTLAAATESLTRSFRHARHFTDRLPAYHRLDLGATWNIKKTDRFESTLNFSLYNAYGRKNAFSIDFEEDVNDPTRTVAVKTYLFTYIPSITYSFKF